MNKALRLILPAALLLASCGKSLSVSEPILVVDGNIRSGEHPRVSVMLSLPVSERPRGSVALADLVVRWADVRIVSDGVERTLTGIRDDQSPLRYIYTDWEMRGEEGKSYTLRVSYALMSVTSHTSIPPSVPIDSVVVSALEGSDSLCRVFVRFTDPAGKGNRYRTFLRSGGGEYLPTMLGVVTDDDFDSAQGEIELFRPHTLSLESYSPYFRRGEELEVLLCTMDQDSYAYWKNFDNASLLAASAFYVNDLSLRSNVEGGAGLWAGYGSSAVKVLVIP